MRDPRAPNLVLAGQAGDVRAGAADPTALDDGSPPPRLRHVPSQQLAALSAAKDQHVKLFRSRHELPPLAGAGNGTFSACLRSCGGLPEEDFFASSVADGGSNKGSPFA